jgi:hypothetical protein
MLERANPSYQSHQRWCALVVLIAVCSLTVSLATRYSSPEGTSAAAVVTVHNVFPPTSSRQRLMKGTAAWHPPVIQSALLDPTTFYPRIAPAGPLMPSVLFDKSLYNRPPPFSTLSA